MQDLLGDRSGGGGGGKKKGKKSSAAAAMDLGDIELGPASTPGPSGDDSGNEFMGEFFKVVERVQRQVAQISENTDRMRDIHEQSLQAVNADQSKEANKELQGVIDETNQLASSVRESLKAMEKDNREFEVKNSGAPESRIRFNHHQTLAREFLESLRGNQEAQQEFKKKFKDQLERQVKIVKPNASRDEITRIMEGNSDQIFAQQTLSSSHMSAATAYLEIQEKNRDIKKIESSLAELHQIFVDFATLVESQGEMIDDISNNVSKSVDYVHKGTEEIKQARVYQAAARKKMCIIICIIIIILAVILGPVLKFGVGAF